MANPYTGQDITGFFLTLLGRLCRFIGGEKLILASDEIQLLTLCFLAFSTTLVGIFLVQARKTMVANALSHTILLGIVAVFLLQRFFSVDHDFAEGLSSFQLLVASFISALLTNFFTEFLTKKMEVQEDAAIGLVFTLFFASGVILLTLFARNVHIGTELVMGSVDTLYVRDLVAAMKIFLFNALIFICCFKEFKIAIFDPNFASLQGLRPAFFRSLLLFQTAWVALHGFQATGVVMLLAFFVAPTLIVRPFVKGLTSLLYGALAVASFVSILGVALSRHLLSLYGVALSTGALVVLLFFLLFFIAQLRLTYSFLATKLVPLYRREKTDP